MKVYKPKLRYDIKEAIKAAVESSATTGYFGEINLMTLKYSSGIGSHCNAVIRIFPKTNQIQCSMSLDGLSTNSDLKNTYIDMENFTITEIVDICTDWWASVLEHSFKDILKCV